MKAIALFQNLPISHPESLVDIELDKPNPGARDLLVQVKAIGVNPVDTKVRKASRNADAGARVLGWDTAGVVIGVGSEVSNFKVGDAVYYAGDITRPGSNSEFHVIDERIVGKKPESLSFEQAAALPLTSITAWEALFDRLHVPMGGKNAIDKKILIIGGAGGVGSIAVQLASRIAGLTVIATASRPESIEWAKKLGAYHVINHFGDMPSQVKSLGFEYADYVLILNNTDQHFKAASEIVAPQGKICTIVENTTQLDFELLKKKSAAFIWEFMFTRSMYQTSDMNKQGELLNQIASYIDAGKILTTVNQVLSPINSANLRAAHQAIEAGHSMGKIVLKDFA